MATLLEELVVRIPADSVELEGALVIPEGAKAITLFAHGSGSSRHSPRNNYVAGLLRRRGLATLLTDLLTADEDRFDLARFDIERLTRRLTAVTRWVIRHARTRGLGIGYFGASTGAAAALKAAAALGPRIEAVVSRGGRPDLAQQALARVESPTLLVVGGHDYGVIELNEKAYEKIPAAKELVIIPGATHLFEEPGALDQVADHAARWFERWVGAGNKGEHRGEGTPR